jgi:hypothetical protein
MAADALKVDVTITAALIAAAQSILLSIFACLRWPLARRSKRLVVASVPGRSEKFDQERTIVPTTASYLRDRFSHGSGCALLDFTAPARSLPLPAPTGDPFAILLDFLAAAVRLEHPHFFISRTVARNALMTGEFARSLW